MSEHPVPTRERLAESVGLVTWPHVAPHHQRSAVFLVSRGVDLVDVAWAVASDDVDEVRACLEDGRLARLDPVQAALWSAEGCPPLRCVIAQPWVLVQVVEGLP